MTRADMMARMSSRELLEWMLFYELEPWGCEVEFFRSSTIAATVANSNRGKKGKAMEVKDFTPEFKHKKAEEEADINSLIGVIAAWNTALGGEDKRNEQPT